MAGSIQGLTVIINGDATRLTKAMREARAEAGILRGHMSQLARLVKFDPSNATLLTRQQQLLSQAVLQTSQRLRTLRNSYAQLSPLVGAMTDAERRQFMSLQREITQTELRMAELRQEAIRTGAAGSLAMQQWAGRFSTVNAAMRSVSSQLMMVSAVSGMLGLTAVRAAADFESSFAGVRKTIIATEAEYEKLAADAIALSLAKPVDVNDINRIMELGGQLNIASQYLTKFAGVMADLDVSTDMNIDEGSLKLAQFVNITGMAQGDVDRLGATIVDLGNNSATTEDRMMNMAMRIAGASSNMGMSAQNTLALAASLSAVGIQAEMGGNAIATIMNKINKDVALNSSSLSTWAQTAGMSASEFKQAWESDVTGALLAVFKGMGQFRDEGNNLNLLLKDMGISYMRQVDTMQRLSRASDLTATLMARSNVAWEQNTALVREATQRYSTAESKIQLMKNSINAMGIAIGQQVLPAFSGLVENVAGAVQAFADMDDGTKRAVVGALAFATVMWPAAKAVELFSGGVSAALRGVMSLKTWLALAAQGQMTYTNMVIASTAAETGNTAALEANGLATIANVTWKDALALAYTRVGVAAIDAAAAMGVSTAAMLGIVGVAVVAAAALAAFGAEAAKSADPMNGLTASCREQARRVSELQGEYDALVASGTATEEQVWRAQAALDSEKASLEASSLTIREFNENIADIAESQAKMAQASTDATRAAEDEAGEIGNLADRIREYASAGELSAEQVQGLQLAISQMNMLVPELELSWDSATGSLRSAAGAWDEVAQAAGRAKVHANAVEQLNDWEAQLAARANDLAEAQANYDEIAGSSVGTMARWREEAGLASRAVEEQGQVLDEARASYEQASFWVEYYGAMAKRTADADAAYTDVIGQLATGRMDMAQAVEYLSAQYGIEATAAQIAEEREKRTAAASEQAAKSASQLADEIEDACEKHATFAAALAVAGVSVEGFAAQLADMGYSAEDVAKGVEDVFAKTSDGLNKIEVDSESTLERLFETLEHNRQVTANWSSNLKALYDGAGSEYRAYVDYLRSLGPEHAQVVQDAFDEMSGDYEAFAAHAREYGDIVEQDMRSAIESYGMAADDFGAVMEQMSEAASGGAEDVGSTVDEMVSRVIGALGGLGEDARTKGEIAMRAYSQAIAEGTAPSEAAALAARVRLALDVGDTYGIGAAVTEGMRAGIADGADGVIAAAGALAARVDSTVRSVLQVNSPSKVMRRTFSFVGEGAALGLMDGVPRVEGAAALLARASIPEASAMMAQVRVQAAEAASARTAARAAPAPAAEVHYHYTVDGVSYLPDSAVAGAIDTVFDYALANVRMGGHG